MGCCASEQVNERSVLLDPSEHKEQIFTLSIDSTISNERIMELKEGDNTVAQITFKGTVAQHALFAFSETNIEAKSKGSKRKTWFLTDKGGINLGGIFITEENENHYCTIKLEGKHSQEITIKKVGDFGEMSLDILMNKQIIAQVSLFQSAITVKLLHQLDLKTRSIVLFSGILVILFANEMI